MRFTRVAASVVAGAAGVALVGGSVLPAGASVTVSAVGWWTSSAAPPSAPSGGVAISNDPSGSSVAALRIDVGGGASSATLKLVETANQVDKTAAMQVCGAANNWVPASGGAFAQAPADTCSAGSVVLAQQTDGSWTADIHQLLAGQTGSASVIVKPAANAAPFQLTFDKATVDGVSLESSSSSSGSNTSDSASTSSATSSDTSSSSSSSFSSSPGSSASLAATPSFTSSEPASSSSAAPSVAPAQDASAASTAAAGSTPAASSDASTSTGSGHFKANVAAGIASGHHSTRGTALGLFALSLLIGAGAAGASWAKAQGLFDLAGLRQRFSR